jgi:hypothetical protein
MDYPEGKEPLPGQPLPKSPYDGLKPKQDKVDISSGDSTVDVELVRGGGR